MKTRALIFNLISFGLMFFIFRWLIEQFLVISYLPLVLYSFLLASIFCPKFLINKNKLFVKLPLIKTLKTL
tara:strand:- start:401 stop:613 length:213 start_codon:yes stop_codon:yes gene_type:complete